MEKGILQSPSQNIQEELDTRCIIIYGKPRNGKTILAASIAHNEYKKRIYANFNIYHKGVSINNRYKYYTEVDNIQYSKEKGVIITDEGGLNLNSKDGFSEANRIMHRVLFLSGKKNCDMIPIAQSYESVDVNFRRNAYAIFWVEKIKRYGRKPLFKIHRVIPWGTGVKIIDTTIMDTLGYMSNYKITYDTLDSSIMKHKKSKEKGLIGDQEDG